MRNKHVTTLFSLSNTKEDSAMLVLIKGTAIVDNRIMLLCLFLYDEVMCLTSPTAGKYVTR
jgi:hypothetical protein